LDNYYKILHPKDQFYHDIYFKNEINYHNYYKYSFNHSEENNSTNNSTNINIQKIIISDYLKGFNWVVNYYHNNNPNYDNIDLTWYFRHNKSPLLKDIINHTNVKLLNVKMNNTFNINLHNNSHNNSHNTKNSYLSPLEHYLFVSPINLDKDMHEQLIKAVGYLSDEKIKLIVNFIKNNTKYYYEINKIIKDINKEKVIDCSGSIFLSKCHIMFMENYISMISFINDIRKYII
jgi:hypothetical protein